MYVCICSGKGEYCYSLKRHLLFTLILMQNLKKHTYIIYDKKKL